MQAKEIMMLLAMVFYLAMVVVVGLIYSKRNKTSEEFYLGGRGLGPWVTAMSAEASDMSSWLLMGLPGLAYAVGIADATWTAIGLAAGTYLNWRLIAVPLRSYTVIAGNSFTVPDFFSNRFHDNKKILMNIAALFILIFFVVYTSSGFVACGKLFNTLFGFDYVPSMLIAAGIIVLYTVVGGFLAESVVDFIQGILMIIALLTITALGVGVAGGLGQVLNSVGSYPGYLSMFAAADVAAGTSSTHGAIAILSGLSWGLGYFGMPHVLLRFMAIRDGSELKKSRRIGTIWCVLSLCLAVFIGVVGRAVYPTLLSGHATENIFIEMCKGLLSNGALPIIAGIMLSGVLAAQISTSDSQLLVASSAVSQNFFKGLLKPDASEREVMWVSRLTIIVVAVMAAVLAFNPNSSIFKIVSFAWAGFGATFGPLVIFSLYFKRTNLAGAVAGMISGGVTVLVWNLVLSKLGGIFKLYELLPAFLISCLFIYVVSLATTPPSAEIQKEFDACRAEVRKLK